MKPRGEKGRLPPFVPLLKDTIKTDAWRATSHGARSLYAALKSRYNNKLGNAVYLSTRIASAELGSHSHRDNVRRWFRELQYYGFIVMVSPGQLGVDGRGKAPHWRLTEEWFAGEPPTRDFLHWDGDPFHEQKSPNSYISKKQNPGPPVRSTVDHPSGPVLDHPFRPVPVQGGPPVQAIQQHQPGPPVQAITSLTTPMLAKGLDCPDDGSIPEFLRRARQ
jgi:hypothetical protein